MPQDRLIPLRISNAALSSGDLPTRLKLLDWGINKTLKGDVVVNEQTVKALAANQAARGYDRVALDYNHNSLKGHANYKEDPRPIAGYGVPELIPGDGLYLTHIIWTPSGKENAANYFDLSPTPLCNKAGVVLFLHSVALCEQGAVDGLSFYSAEFLALTGTSAGAKKGWASRKGKLAAAVKGRASAKSSAPSIDKPSGKLDRSLSKKFGALKAARTKASMRGANGVEAKRKANNRVVGEAVLGKKGYRSLLAKKGAARRAAKKLET